MKKVTFVVMHVIVMLIILPATFLLIPQHAAAMPDIDNQILQPENGSQIFQPENGNQILQPDYDIQIIQPNNNNQILQPEDMVTFIVEVPYGSKGNGLAVQGSNFSAYIFVESFRHGEMNITTHLDLPDVFVLHDPASESFILQTEYDGWYRFVDFCVPQDVPCGVYNITTTASIDFQGRHAVIERTTALKVASREEVAQMISITDVVMPSDDTGSGDLSRPMNTIVLQETSPAIKSAAKIAGIDLRDDNVKVSHIGVTVKNSGEDTVPLIISYDIVDILTGEQVEGFKPTLMGMSSSTFSYASILLPPDSTELVVLPVYASQSALGGEYRMHVRAAITGSEWEAAERDEVITAVSRKWTPIITSLGAFFLALGGIGVFILRSNRIMNSFSTRHLVMISLFGTASFAAVNIPMTFMWDVSHAVLGPFSFLFTGIFYEVILYMLIVSAVMLMPKPGVVTLLIAVRFLLNGIVLGHFNPIFLLSYSVNATALELLLYTSGITRGRSAGKLRMGLVCGTADALSQYVSFSLWMVLYRLFYSDWYIKANIFIDGFIYTFIGAWLGINLGNKLKKVVE